MSNAGKWHSVQNLKPTARLQKYCKDRQVESHQGTGLWSVPDPTRDAVLVTKNLRNPSINVRQLKVATNFPHMNISYFGTYRNWSQSTTSCGGRPAKQ